MTQAAFCMEFSALMFCPSEWLTSLGDNVKPQWGGFVIVPKNKVRNYFNTKNKTGTK